MNAVLPRGLGLLALPGLLLGSCSTSTGQSSSGEQAAAAEAIRIDGSSTVYPLTDEVVKELQFEKSEDAPEITVAFSGTGGGFRKFCAGEIDINNASRPILKEEMEACVASGVEYIELPVAFDALTVVVHGDNSWAQDITVDELKAIWEPGAEGTITRWNQVRPSLPNRPLKLYGADTDSGTYDYFTEAVVGQAGDSRSDYQAESDDVRLVREIRRDPDALGFFGFAYYDENRNTLKALSINSGEGPVEPSADTVQSGEYEPLTRPLFIYVNAERAAANPALKELAQYYLTNVGFLARTVGYVPLPTEAYGVILERLEQGKTGTVFAGEAPTDLTIETLIEREI